MIIGLVFHPQTLKKSWSTFIGSWLSPLRFYFWKKLTTKIWFHWVVHKRNVDQMTRCWAMLGNVGYKITLLGGVNNSQWLISTKLCNTDKWNIYPNVLHVVLYYWQACHCTLLNMHYMYLKFSRVCRTWSLVLYIVLSNLKCQVWFLDESY